MAITQGKKVAYADDPAKFYKLLVNDGLRVAKGSNGLLVERCPDNDGNWVAWSTEGCEVTVEGSLLADPAKSFKITIKATAGTISHLGDVGGITGATWTAEEGP